LNKYDFESELDVNILGHIFEQSISDLETLKTKIPISSENQDLLIAESGETLVQEHEELSLIEKQGRRKKEGIFYTPDFVTQFLVENVVGRFLEANPDKLESIKVLDPACGSGAFLNQTHSYLMKEYKMRQEQKMLDQADKRQLDFSDINLAETNRSILLNNLYGVDLNPESVEITKLSLWLKTARSSEPLQNLDKNIKWGNSIVDDPEFAGARAFNWHKEFPDILKDGGFDVIIGNPPYVRQELIKNIKPYLETKYKVYSGVSDLYVYFFEKALDLLKENGYFAFIVSSKFLRADYGKKLTQYLQQNFTILELIDFGDLQIFEGATTYPCIITIQKKKPADLQSVPFLKLKSLDVVSDLGMALKKDGQTIEIKRNDDSWQLRSIEENNVLQKIRSNNTTLDGIVNKQLLRGIITGFNEAFIITSEVKEQLVREDPKCDEVIKPILIGKDIHRYSASWQGLWCIVIPAGWTNSRRGNIAPEDFFQSYFPSIYTQLKAIQANFSNGTGNGNGHARKKGLLNRDDQGDYWWELRPCVYYKSFEGPKIIWGNLSIHASFSYDPSHYYISAPACFIPTAEKWLLAILNSKVSSFFLRNTAIERQGGFIEQKPMYVKELPIPTVSNEIKGVLSNKVASLMQLHKEREELLRQSLEVLKTEYAIRKVTQKLQNFLSLGWNEFIEELEKQHTQFSLKQKDELNTWFRSKQKGFQMLEHKIKTIDGFIDGEVYNLFLLNNSDKLIILKKYL
jgi:type I restriction-modification system DNA methylase subunit